MQSFKFWMEKSTVNYLSFWEWTCSFHCLCPTQEVQTYPTSLARYSHCTIIYYFLIGLLATKCSLVFKYIRRFAASLKKKLAPEICPVLFFFFFFQFYLICFMSVVYLYIEWYVGEDFHWTFAICTLFSLYRLLGNSALLGDFEHATMKCETIVLGNTS